VAAFLLMMYGLPGSGKSTIAAAFASEYDFVHLSIDKMRARIDASSYYNTRKYNRVLTVCMDEAADSVLRAGHSVVYDKNLNLYRLREGLRRMAAQHNAIAVVVHVKLDKQTAIERAVQRQTDFKYDKSPTELVNLMQGTAEPPRPDEPTIALDATRTITENVELLAKQLESLT
jgi:predicted kinase